MTTHHTTDIDTGIGAARLWLMAAAESAVYRALELAGKRLRNKAPRRYRHHHGELASDVDPWEIHTVTGALAEPEVRRLLTGAFTLAERTIPDACVRHTVELYTVSLLCSGRPHRLTQLAAILDQQGCTKGLTR